MDDETLQSRFRGMDDTFNVLSILDYVQHDEKELEI